MEIPRLGFCYRYIVAQKQAQGIGCFHGLLVGSADFHFVSIPQIKGFCQFQGFPQLILAFIR